MTQYDLAAAEQQMRAQSAQAVIEGDKLIASGNADREFVHAQRRFDEARIQFTLAIMGAENAGVDRNVYLGAAGFALGQQWGAVLLGCVGARERSVTNGWLQQGLAAMIGDQQATKTIETVIKPMVMQ